MPKLAAFFLVSGLCLGRASDAQRLRRRIFNFAGDLPVTLGLGFLGRPGVIFSACYLLWSYQRVFLGEVTVDKNKTLPDTSGREIFILVTMSIVMLWMGIGSTYFTQRTAASAQTIIDQVEPQRPYEATAPSHAAPTAAIATTVTAGGAR